MEIEFPACGAQQAGNIAFEHVVPQRNEGRSAVVDDKWSVAGYQFFDESVKGPLIDHAITK